MRVAYYDQDTEIYSQKERYCELKEVVHQVKRLPMKQ